MPLRSPRGPGIRVGGPDNSPVLLRLVLAVSLLANVYFLFFQGDAEVATPSEVTLTEATVALAQRARQEKPETEPAAREPAAKVKAPPARVVESVVSPEAPPEQEASSLPEEGVTSAGAESVKPLAQLAPIPADFVRVRVDGPVARGFVKKLGSPLGDRLALTAGRLLIWNLDLRKDPRPGDLIDVLYQVDQADPTSIEILGLTYESGKFDETFEFYRFHPSGWPFPSWFDEEGREVPAVLQDGPIREYKQITSLLGDGRGHSGMDFKAPVGTPIQAPFDGVVTRVNWRFRYNGNCLELQASDGTTARFLHLDSLVGGVKAGSRVKKGQALAASGNTGRSSNPHLHYELSSPSGRTVDPLDFHESRHRRLQAGEQQPFGEERDRLKDWLVRSASAL